MSDVEITHMTSKGQVVIPSAIRKEISAAEGTVFAVFGSGDTIVLKKIRTPSAEQFKRDWAALVREGSGKAKALGIREADAAKIVQKRRSDRQG